ncbi:EAL domain-containing protein [Engelhardtia mirabilis]|uniref:Cyclic di-GMP phosphodiesterase YfgF n=1 Tax=Engelhardtia mirabilis TaxID=2528011 RepID=A0A518BHQ5_9BACT|nr:Cyclic di-GMP phosphodiesterase YfgF [Planctomycetes bacterium Pla133]QDV00827.1 Cyclic di-GMP phosphodiesterase YfgF [Planctomycetes bacterium Pla86]
MNERYFALLIGVNRYVDPQLPPLSFAEKDCSDLRDALGDPAGGCFHPSNIELLLGEDATTDAVETALHRTVVSQRQAGDTVLVYFSGHGFTRDIGGRRHAYIATHDVSIRSLLTNPQRGLRMDFLHREILLQGAADRVICILDCCNSGSIVPAPIRDTKSGSDGVLYAPAATLRRSADQTGTDLVDRGFLADGTGRIALVACPHDAVSRESPSLENGVFTHFLIRGLRGAASEIDTGEVTVDSLLAHVRTSTPADQPPGRYGQDFGRIVLSRPGTGRTDPSTAPIRFQISSERAPGDAPAVTPLSHHLDSSLSFCTRFRGELDRASAEQGANLDAVILRALSACAGASLTFILREERETWAVRGRSPNDVAEGNRGSLLEGAVRAIGPSLENGTLFSRFQHGIIARHPDKGEVLGVPLTSQNPREAAILCSKEAEFGIKSDWLGRLVQAVYESSRQLTSINPALIEGHALDQLKSTYGFLPKPHIDRRFELFTDRLNELIIHFEPIVRLSPTELHICGWEALARDPLSLVAPTDLFEAAKLWGVDFSTELDLKLLRKAVQSYREARSATRDQRRPEDVQDLSVNVFASTLNRAAYEDALEDILADGLILPERLILEISESTQIPMAGADRGETLARFRIRLSEFVARLGVSFAIDDFGVGEGSIERLTGLSPECVKVDRSVLQNRFAAATIQFVLQLAGQERLRPARVIVEGVDGESLLGIEDLYALGVRYIQGYVVRRAAATLGRLDREVAEALMVRLRNGE